MSAIVGRQDHRSDVIEYSIVATARAFRYNLTGQIELWSAASVGLAGVSVLWFFSRANKGLL